ncbi:hypothetical protein AB1N83_012601 [Pleurotus pulmonarius]
MCTHTRLRPSPASPLTLSNPQQSPLAREPRDLCCSHAHSLHSPTTPPLPPKTFLALRLPSLPRPLRDATAENELQARSGQPLAYQAPDPASRRDGEKY